LRSIAAATLAAAALAWVPGAVAQDDTYYQGYAQDPGAYNADPAAPAPEATTHASGGGDTLSQIGWGALTAVTNLAYVPAKLAYAGLGGLTGSLALGLTGGDMSTAQQIWEPSLGGDYFLTPGQIQGEKGVSFAGAAPQLTEPAPAAPGASDDAPPTDPVAPQYGG
jgi:hypothetical protein